MYFSKKAEISTLLTVLVLFTAVTGFSLGSFVGSQNSQSAQANSPLKEGVRCVISNSKCEKNLICLPRYSESDLAKITSNLQKQAAKDEGICKSLSQSQSPEKSAPTSVSKIADTILNLKNSDTSKEIATLLETGQISTGDGSKNSPFQINPSQASDASEGRRFVARGGICSAEFSFIKDPWVSKISVRKATANPQNEIYAIDTTSQALDNSLPPESFPRLLSINGSTVRWVWNPKSQEMLSPSKPNKANNFLSTALGGGQSINHFYEASSEKFTQMTTEGELIVRLFYQTTKTDQKDTVYMYQDVKVADCKNGVTPTIISPSVTPTLPPSSTPSTAPTLTLTPPPLTLTATPKISFTPTPTNALLSVTPFNNTSPTPTSPQTITNPPQNLKCNDICNPGSTLGNQGCPSSLVCAPEVGTGIPPNATFRCFLPNYHSTIYECQIPSPTPKVSSPTPSNSPTPSTPLKACYGSINLVVDVTTTNKNNLQNIKNTVIASLDKSLALDPNQTTTFRLFKFSKSLTSFASGKLLSISETKAELAKNCDNDKSAFLCYSPNTDIKNMVDGLATHYQNNFFVEPYFVITDGLHYYENDRQLEYSGLYFNNKLKSQRTVGADYYPYASDLRSPESDPILLQDEFGRLDANLAAKKQVTVSKGSKRTYNDAMIDLIAKIHDKLGFAPERDINYTPHLDKSFVYNFSSKYPNIIPIASTSSSAYPGVVGEYNPEILNILGRHSNLPSTVTGGKNFATLSLDSNANTQFLTKLFSDLSGLGCLKKPTSTIPQKQQFAYQLDLGKTNGLTFTGYATNPNLWDMCYTVSDDKGITSSINNEEFFRTSGPGIDTRGKSDNHCGSGKTSDFVLSDPLLSNLKNLSAKYKNNTSKNQLIGIQANRCPTTKKGPDNKIHCDNALSIDDSVSQNGGYILQLDLKAGEEVQAHWNNPSKNDYLTLSKNQNNRYLSTCNIGKNAPLPHCQKQGKIMILAAPISGAQSNSNLNISQKKSN